VIKLYVLITFIKIKQEKMDCRHIVNYVCQKLIQNHFKIIKKNRTDYNLNYNKTDKAKQYRRESGQKKKYDNDNEYRKKCINSIVEREKRLLKTNIEFKIVKILRSRLRSLLKNDKYNKNNYNELPGCSISFLKIYIENKFTDGMSWDNHGKLHLDHIKPCSLYNLKDKEEQLKCFHYTNLQPLWAKDNLIKGSKYIETK